MKPELQRRIQRYGWDQASNYYENAWQEQIRPAQDRLLQKADLKKGERVLDLACGTGLVTLPAAEAVGSSGEVVGVDISEEMLQMAHQKAGTLGFHHVSFKRQEAEKLDLPDNHFEVALCALGLMYVPDPLNALRQMHRVLKPGGRTIVLVWGERDRCGWASIFPIVEKRVSTEVCPMFFQLGSGEALQKALEMTGFKDIKLERFSSTLHYETAEEACEAAFKAGPVAMAYRRFDETKQQEAHAEYIASIEPYRREEEYAIPGEFVVGTGYR